mgnify:CR=1 FL=1
MAFYRIEIAAGRGGDMDLAQHLLGETHGIIGETRDVAERVKGTVHRRGQRQSQLRHAAGEKLAVLRVAGLHLLHLVDAVEGRFSGDLREFGRADIEALGETLDGPDQIVGQHHPADPPAGHAEILRERVDDDRPVGDFERGRLLARKCQSVIDLVGDEDRLARLAPVRQRLQIRLRRDGSRRIGGACHHDACDLRRVLALPGLDRLRRQHIVGFRAHRDLGNLQPQRGQNIAIGRIAGPGDGNRFARSEELQECQVEAGRGAVGHGDPARIDGDAVAVLIVAGDRGAQP